MRFHGCDEIGSDIFEAAREFGCAVRIDVIISVMDYVARSYRPGLQMDFERILDEGLEVHEPMTEDEHHAYKLALGRIYNRRAQESRGAKSSAHS